MSHALFLYLDHASPVHRLDPRTKLVLLLESFLLPVVFARPLELLVLLCAVVAYGGIARVLGNLRRISVLLLSIAAVSVVSWSLFTPGAPVVWRVTREGLLYGAGAAIKIDAMIISGLIFLSTTKTEEIVLGLLRLRVPFGMAFAFSLAVRMVPTIIGTALTVAEAQRSRGLDLSRGGPLGRIRNYIPLLAPIFLQTMRSTDLLAKALEARGFGARHARTSFLEIGMHGRDLAALTAGALVFGGLFLLRSL
jgi:energy-coupling factor transport system permease protein